MVARMRARQSATSLLGAQARAGVRPEAERQRGGQEDEDREEAGRQSKGQRRSSIPLVFSRRTVQTDRHGNAEHEDDHQRGLDKQNPADTQRVHKNSTKPPTLPLSFLIQSDSSLFGVMHHSFVWSDTSLGGDLSLSFMFRVIRHSGLE